LSHLSKLSLQSNRIVDIGTGLLALTSLTELYLSENGIERISGLHTLVNLHTLDLSINRISELDGLETLTELREFWVRWLVLSSCSRC